MYIKNSLLPFYRPSFLILASDGLWDTFTNEEACSFIKEHINEPDFGAKSLALQSYYRGSVDNITVLVIAFKNGVYRISSAANNHQQATSNASSSATAHQNSAVQNNGHKETAKSAASAIASTNLNRSNSVRNK